MEGDEKVSHKRLSHTSSISSEEFAENGGYLPTWRTVLSEWEWENRAKGE
jgi:hypothetical protein